MMTPSKNHSLPLRSLLTASLFLAPPSAVWGELVAYWDFDDPVSAGNASVDERGGQAAQLLGGAAFTPDAEGRTASVGDKAMRFGTGNQRLQVISNFFTSHFAGNEATVSFWIKHNGFKQSTSVSFVAPGPLTRAFQAHTPWSDGNVYFDTGGASAAANRINAGLGATAGVWHHIALVRKNDAGNTNKWVYRDGVEVASGVNDPTIAQTINQLIIGNAPSTVESVNGDMDEVAVFDVALTPAQVADLASSTTTPADYQTAVTDSDSDGLPDLWETSFFPGDLTQLSATGDKDGDGLDDIDELAWGANPNDDDSDNDGLLDGAEITAGASPLDADSDDDGLLDGVETGTGTFVSTSDTGTDPTLADTDGDFADDATEIAYGTDPTDISFRPTLLAYWDFNDDSVATSSIDVRGGRVGNLAGTAVYSADAEGITGLAGDKAFSPSGGNLQSPNATWLNMATNNDQITVMFWQKNTQVGTTTFNMNAPSADGERGLQTHAPWVNGQIYFDNGGTNAAAGQRINKASGITWSNEEWHHFAFVKNAGTMQIYLDGALFHSGTGAQALKLDFNTLTIGGGVTGVIDDFAVYSVGLTAQDVMDVYDGTKTPLELEDVDMDGLPDSWEYAYFPADLTQLSGAGNLDSDGLTDADEYALGTDPTDVDTDDDGLNDEIENDSGVWVSVTDTGTNPLVADTDGDGLLDGVENNSGTYNSQTDTGTDPHLVDSDNDGFSDRIEGPNGFNPNNPAEFPVFNDGRYLMAYWKFDDASVPAQSVDEVNSHTGVVTGSYTAEGEGFSETGTDRAVCFGAGQNVLADGAFLNLAASSNAMTISFWQKIDSATASAFWFTSPSSAERGIQAHSPHSSGIIYFDHSGCCTSGQTRIQTGNVTSTGSGEVVFGQWQHFAYVKDGNTKNVYIDGNLVLTGGGTAPLVDDFANMYIGSTNAEASMDGCLDEFAVFAGALSGPQVALLANGTETPDTVLDAATIYATWATANGLTAGVNDGPTQNPDFDALNNLLEFAFGTNPNTLNSGGLTWDGSNPAVTGVPVVDLSFPAGGGADLKARFMRRKDHGTTSSVSYIWEFSADLTTWESSDDSPDWFVAPSDIADDASGDYDLVEVPYPLFLDSGQKARYFRVKVTEL